MNLECGSFQAKGEIGRERLVVLAPHPDDESLGCGALLARVFAGAGAHVICLTDGSASHPNSAQWPAARLAARRRAELEAAIMCLGGTASDLTWMGLRDAELYRLDPARMATDLLPIVDACGARHILAPAAEDHHEDHKVVAEVAKVMRRLRPDWTFYSYPVWCRWDDPEFDRAVLGRNPIHLNTDQWRVQKRAAIGSHLSQLGKVVLDDPDGFVLPTEMIEKFVNADEIFWRMP
ncbi:MAG: PIG-L family deacetylase [Roseovarius sp.]